MPYFIKCFGYISENYILFVIICFVCCFCSYKIPSAVPVSLFALNPCCLLLLTLYVSVLAINLRFISFSKSLPVNFRSEIGRKFVCFVGDLPGFGMKIIIDFFHMFGKYPDFKQEFKICTRLCSILFGRFDRWYFVMPSSPGDLCLKEFIALIVSVKVILMPGLI